VARDQEPRRASSSAPSQRSRTARGSTLSRVAPADILPPFGVEGLVLEQMKMAFRYQRRRAKQRNIPFDLTFDQFVAFWSVGDRWARRGTGADDLVMSRIADEGGYAEANIFCQTQAENGLEASDRRNAT
jgi:hypothetical protein